MFGHNEELISERICPRTYGISVGTVSTPRHLTSLSLIAYMGYSLDDSYTSTFATASNALFGAHVNSKLLFLTIRGSPDRYHNLEHIRTNVETILPLS
jgi:hypothetical protein